MDETAMEIHIDGKHGLSLKQGLNRLYKDKTLCDVILTSSDGVDIQAHWLVLAAHSDFLRHLAVSRNVMQSVVSDSGSLKLNIESEVLKMILGYLYTGELVVTKDSLHKIKLAAKVLQLPKALALLERSHLSGLGDQSCEAESKILQPTASLQTPVLEQQQLQRQEDQEFAVMGTLTQSPASYQVQSMQPASPYVQVQSTASHVLYSQGYLQSTHYDNDSHRIQQPATVLQVQASPLQPTILSVESVCGSQTAFSSASFSNAYRNQRPDTKNSSHEHSHVSHGKDGVVCTQNEGPQQNVSVEISPCMEVSITNNLDDGLKGSSSQTVHSSDNATSHKAQTAFCEPSFVPPEHESAERGSGSEPTQQTVGGKRTGGPMNSVNLNRPVGKKQTVIQTRRGRPATTFKGFNLNVPKFQCSSAKYVNLSTGERMHVRKNQINQNESSASFGVEAVSTYLSQERPMNEQKERECSHLSTEIAAQNKTLLSSGSYITTRDSVEVDLGLVKTEKVDGESNDLDYVIYENTDTSDTDSCVQSLSHCAQDKARNCKARKKIFTSRLQKHSSHGSTSHYRLRSVLRSKYLLLLSQYVQDMCIWKTEMSPFWCRVCNRRFKHLGSLKHHCLSIHLSKLRRLKRNLPAEAVNPPTPSSHASMMECNSVSSQHRTGISRSKGHSLTKRAKGKSLTKRGSQTPGSDDKDQRTRKCKPLKFVLPTITEGSSQEGEWIMSRWISTEQDQAANTSQLQGEDRHNVVLDNGMPSTTTDRNNSEDEKQDFKPETSETKELYVSPRYPCSNCGKPFHLESTMLRHFKTCNKDPDEQSQLQEGEERQNVVSENSMPFTSADSTSSEGKKQHFKQENSRIKESYTSSRYPCNNCGKPFHFRSNMLRHFTACSKLKVKDNEIPHGKVIVKPKKMASSSVVEVKKSPKERATNFQLVKKYTNGTTCTLCNKTFSRADTTRMHIRAVHFQQKTYTCVCKEEFFWSTALSTHKKTCQLIARQKANISSF
ncbi:uncharacterized protein [Haliotis asinina]